MTAQGTHPEIEAIVTDAMTCYFGARRAMVPVFVDRHFGIRGALALNRKALGLDLLRAPVNLALMVPVLAGLLTASLAAGVGANRLSRTLNAWQPFLETDVAREVTWLLHSELLELPFKQGQRRTGQDALATEIISDPRVSAALQALLAPAIRRHGEQQARIRLANALAGYTGARAAVADIANAMVMMGTGAITLKQVTPGALSLGPAVATSAAHYMAISSFPLGATLGGAWYGLFPAAPSTALVIGSTTGIITLSACAAALSGIVTDPLQKHLGIHQRRLMSLIKHLQTSFADNHDGRFHVRDHYVARLADLLDVARAALR